MISLDFPPRRPCTWEVFNFEGSISGSLIGAPTLVNFYVEGDKMRAQAINKKYSPIHRALFAKQRGASCS